MGPNPTKLTIDPYAWSSLLNDFPHCRRVSIFIWKTLQGSLSPSLVKLQMITELNMSTHVTFVAQTKGLDILSPPSFEASC